jgi:hypothetical protein
MSGIQPEPRRSRRCTGSQIAKAIIVANFDDSNLVVFSREGIAAKA